MLANSDYFWKKREGVYDREIRTIMHEFSIEKGLSQDFFISRVSLSAKGESLRIYLGFFPSNKDEEAEIKKINEIYPNIIKRKIAISKNFSNIPSIFFLIDKGLKEDIEIEKIFKELKLKNE